ncbi:hypothetical protein B296_00043151 [Ensete ventricosum]|uniref:Uncharacterized protein n=1 Tax=Ensete ventricosum TaxID=4639 RepID=A0A426X8A9_ENSVE|nr:hypothetical protein B296_00043151 [Ensete ventricosum]
MNQDQVSASGQGLDDAVGAHWEFVEGIEKLARNTPGDRWRKTVRLTARMSKASELAGQAMVVPPRPTVVLLIPGLQGAFDDGTIGAGGCIAYTHFFHEFVEGIGKLVRNTLGDRWRKTIRLVARMPKATELVGVRSLFSMVVLMVVIKLIVVRLES